MKEDTAVDQFEKLLFRELLGAQTSLRKALQGCFGSVEGQRKCIEAASKFNPPGERVGFSLSNPAVQQWLHFCWERTLETYAARLGGMAFAEGQRFALRACKRLFYAELRAQLSPEDSDRLRYYSLEKKQLRQISLQDEAKGADKVSDHASVRTWEEVIAGESAEEEAEVGGQGSFIALLRVVLLHHAGEPFRSNIILITETLQDLDREFREQERPRSIRDVYFVQGFDIESRKILMSPLRFKALRDELTLRDCAQVEQILRQAVLFV